MPSTDRHFVLGYDPGGNGRHGLAVLQVQQQQGLWVASHIAALKALPDVQAVIECAKACIDSEDLVATGVDTLTAWSGGPSGWRPADLWLRERYPAVKNSVASPNSLFGSMSIGGGLLMHWLSQRQDHGGVVTEGWRWLLQEFGLFLHDETLAEDADHSFDALMGCLAALRGLNGQWTLDLHEAGRATEVHPFGPTHYWWPDVGA